MTDRVIVALLAFLYNLLVNICSVALGVCGIFNSGRNIPIVSAGHIGINPFKVLKL